MMTTRPPEELVQYAQVHQEIHNVNQTWLTIEEIVSLAALKGAELIHWNIPQGNDYSYRVKYKEYEFIALSQQPLTLPIQKKL